MEFLSYNEEDNHFPQIYAEGVSEALFKALHVLDRQPEVPSRDGTTKEVMNARFIINEPRDRFIRLKGRKHNVFSQIGETLWVLSGEDGLKYLSLFLPRAEQFSDDGGKTWRSAYGKRLRNYPTGKKYKDPRVRPDGVDQLEAVIKKLTSSKETRRAFTVLTYPPVDHSDGIDVVCNVALHFLIRNNRLHMTIHNRSNDAIWGFSGINFFEFTVLQEVLVDILQTEYGMDVEIGSYVHNSMSYHVYSRHYERMEGILKNNGRLDEFDEDRHFPFKVGSLSAMDNCLGCWLNFLEGLRRQKNSLEKVDDGMLREYIAEFIHKTSVRGGHTLPVYASITLLYVALKHGLVEGEHVETYDMWYGYYSGVCNELGIEPEETYFLHQVNEKLLNTK